MSSNAHSLTGRSLARLAALAFLIASVTVQSADEASPVLVAKRDLAVLEAPRNGLFCQHGAELGRLAKDSRITTYSSVKSFCGLFVAIEYVKFEYETKPGTKVTAYVRRKETNGTDRFSLQSRQEAP